MNGIVATTEDMRQNKVLQRGHSISNQSRIYMTVFDFDETLCVRLCSQLHVTNQISAQSDLPFQR